MTNAKLRLMFISILLAVWLNVAVVSAQTASASDTLLALPTSDLVGYCDVRRILTEIVPRLLAKDPATLAKMMNALNDVYTKTGINILSIDRVAAGLQFVGPASHDMKKENLGIVILIHGEFDADKLIAFIKSESKGKQGEETYGGKVIYSEPRPNDPHRKKSERQVAAITMLDANTLAIGDLPQVRAAVDAASGKGRVDAALAQLAMRDTGTVIGTAGNVPPELTQDLSKSAPPNDEAAQAINKLIANIKQVFGSIGATQTDFNVILGARLGSAEQAQSLNDTLLGLRQQIGPNVEDKQFRDLLNNLQITAQGDEVQLKANIPNEVVQELSTSMIKESAGGSKPVIIPETKTAPAKSKTTTKSRRRRRGRRH